MLGSKRRSTMQRTSDSSEILSTEIAATESTSASNLQRVESVVGVEVDGDK